MFFRGVLEHRNNSQKIDLEPQYGLQNVRNSKKENEGFRGSVVLQHCSKSQKMDLEWASI